MFSSLAKAAVDVLAITSAVGTLARSANNYASVVEGHSSSMLKDHQHMEKLRDIDREEELKAKREREKKRNLL